MALLGKKKAPKKKATQVGPPKAPVTPLFDTPQTRRPHIIGLTGAFGSGCTTAAKFLRDERAYTYIKLSDVIRTEWRKSNTREPEREEQQRLGDDMRKQHGSGALIVAALQQIGTVMPPRVVFDGIRNVGEVDALQERFGHRFTLFAIITPTDARWDRIGTSAYTDRNKTYVDFSLDDARDKNEETPYGQQVELCVDRSDVLIDNGPPVDNGQLKQKVISFADLVSGDEPRHARQPEVLMNIAYGSSHSSKCLKRHVGAVIVDKFGQVVGVGYNENPIGTAPCVEETEYQGQCYRDIVRNAHFAGLASRGARCPECGERLTGESGPPWRCSACDTRSGKKTNLEAFFFPDRAMNMCTAIHAEVWAILAAGERARGGTLYTTTFPCAQCAEKIIHVGIGRVLYTESYPDAGGKARLVIAKIPMERFEGVRSSKFERIFSPVRPI